MGERTADVDGTSAEEHKRAMPGKTRHAMISQATPAPPDAPEPIANPLPVMTGPLSGTPPGEGGTPTGTSGLGGCVGMLLPRVDAAPGAGKTFRAAADAAAPAGWRGSGLPAPAPGARILPPGTRAPFGVPVEAVPVGEGCLVPEDDAEPVPEGGGTAVPGWVGEVSPVTAVVTVDAV